MKMSKNSGLVTQKSEIAILVLNLCSISAVFPIVLFVRDQKTALTGESLYVFFNFNRSDFKGFFDKSKKKKYIYICVFIWQHSTSGLSGF